jgi:hypothetical protein
MKVYEKGSRGEAIAKKRVQTEYAELPVGNLYKIYEVTVEKKKVL